MSGLLVATGESLVRVGGGTPELLLERPGLRSVALDPSRPERILAGCHSAGVWESEDGGATWHDAELPAEDVFSVAFSPADGAVYAGCEPSALYVRRNGGPWEELAALRELPSAPTWSFPPRPWTSHVRWIAPSPHEAELVLVGIELGGLMRTTDGGATWVDHRPGAQKDVHQLAWHPSEPGRAYEAGGGGSAWSRDGGDTWEPADEGRDRHYTWALAPDPADPDCWFVSASTGPFAAHGDRPAEAGLYRWRGSGPWEELDLGLERPLETMPYALAARDGSLVAGLRDGRLFESEDGGDSWRQLVVDGLPAVVAMAA
ncbi:MAG TPA: hypothetical protein VFW80_02575 [Gaiellaceae bacterium]|nr:hypothetical protein [Gaiellaceae bacterium]